MNTYYATFGVKYAREEHPTLPENMADPDGVMKVIAPTEALARLMVYGVTNNSYCFLVPWPDPGSEEEAQMNKWFPKGVTSTLSLVSTDLIEDAV